MSDHHGKVWWSELSSSDVKKSVAYYSELMGWTVETMPMGEGVDYYIFKSGDAFVAGAMAKMPEMADIPDHWMTYLAVADVDASVAATEAAGGTVLNPPFDMPGTGRIAMVLDPTGATVGLMTPE